MADIVIKKILYLLTSSEQYVSCHWIKTYNVCWSPSYV